MIHTSIHLCLFTEYEQILLLFSNSPSEDLIFRYEMNVVGAAAASDETGLLGRVDENIPVSSDLPVSLSTKL